jgi:UDP-2,3-diacylglucosamine pyrophosphatase LpxH
MLLEQVKTWFAAHSLPFEWRREGKIPAYSLLAPPKQTQLDLGSTKVGIVIPDCHLGWGNDVFRYNDQSRERRLERFLDAVALLRDALSGALTAVQLGDWYDFWRSPGITPAEAKRLIEEQYPGVVERARRLPLLHCVGNHDAELLRPGIGAGLDVEIVRTIGTPSILCVHGHDRTTFESIAVDGTWESLGLNVLNLVNSAPGIGRFGSLIQKCLDQSFAEPTSDDMTSLPWDAAKVGGPNDWLAPWVDRSGAAQLGQSIRGYELCVDRKVQALLIGHSHRPGISWSPVTQTRRVPVIDVGSWTYGRAEFAVVCSDGIGLAALTP